jgi:hypothetical protein
MFSKTSLLGSSTLSSALPTTYADIRGEDIMTDPRVIADVRKEFEDRGIYIADDDELMRKFYDDQTFSKLNATVGPFNAYQRAEAATPESRARQARLRDAHNKLPAFFQKGGVGAGTALPSYGKALLFDPINLVGGFVGAGGKGVVKAVQAARASGGSTTLAGLRAGATRGAVAEGVLGAGFGGVYSVGQQNVDIKLGLQDEFSFGRLAADVAGEAAFSAGLGAGIGGAAGAVSGAIRGSGPAPTPATPPAATAPVTVPQTPQEELADRNRALKEAREDGDVELEEEIMEEIGEIYATSYDLDGFYPDEVPSVSQTDAPSATQIETGAAPNVDAAPSAETADVSAPEAAGQPEATATEAAEPEAKKAEPKIGGTSKKAKVIAEKEGLDISVNTETNTYADPDIEAFVIRREQIQNVPKSKGLTRNDLEQFLAERGQTTGEAGDDASSMVVDAIIDAEKVESVTGEPVPQASIGANLEKQAVAADMSEEQAAKLQETLQAYMANYSAEAAARISQLSPAEIIQLKQRVRTLEATGVGLEDAVGTALDEVFRGRTISGTTPERMADRTAKAGQKMATSENAGRSLTDVIDPQTGRTTQQPSRYQWMFAKGYTPPTFGSVDRQYAQQLAEQSLQENRTIYSRDSWGERMAANKRTFEQLSPEEQAAFNAKVEALVKKGVDEADARSRALNIANRDKVKALREAEGADVKRREYKDLAPDEKARYSEYVEEFVENGLFDSEARTRALAKVNNERLRVLRELEANDMASKGEGLKAENGIIVYKTSTRTQAHTLNGKKELVDRGSIVIYDANLKQSFAGDTFEEASEVLRLRVANSEKDRVTRRADAASRDVALAQFEDANGVTHVDIGETAKRLTEADFADMPELAATKGDLVLTVRAKPVLEGISRPVRQLSVAQIEQGKGFRDLLGAPRVGQMWEPRHDPSNWEAYYLPRLKGKGKDKKLADMMETTPQIKVDRLNAPGSVYSLDAQMSGPPLLMDIAGDKLPAPETAEEAALFKMYIDEGQPLDTYGDLMNRQSSLWRTDLSSGNARQLVQRATMLYSYMRRILPQGIVMPQATRSAAYKALGKIYEGHPTEILDMVYRVLGGVQSDGAPTFTRMPEEDIPAGSEIGGRFRASDSQVDEFVQGDPKFASSGTIELNPDSQFHPVHVMLHELGHWGADYLLTPQVKGAFFAEIANYLDDYGNLQMDRLGLGGAPMGVEIGKNFHEIFANMFTKYGSDKVFRRQLEATGNSFFAKIKKVFRQLFEFFMSGKVPEKFDPMFANILSDTERLYFSVDDYTREPKTEGGKHIRKRYKELQEVRAAFTMANVSGSGYEEPMRQFMSFIYGQTNSKAQNRYIANREGGQTRGNNTGVFLPILELRNRILLDMKALNDLTNTVEAASPALRGVEIEELPFTYATYDDNVHRAITNELQETGTIGRLLEEIENLYMRKYELREGHQSYDERYANRIAAEERNREPITFENQAENLTGQVTNSVKERKKDRFKSLVNSAFFKSNANRSEEDLDKLLTKSNIPTDASMDELINMLSLDEGTEVQPRDKYLAQRLKRMADAEPPISKQKGKYDTGKSQKELFKLMMQAADRNDLKDYHEILGAYRRAGGKDNLAPQDGMVDNLRYRESEQNGLALDGVSINTRPQIRSLQEAMNARRDGEATATMRQLFFRMMNMLGGTTLERDGPIKNRALAKIVGEDASALGDAALSPDSPTFKAVRNSLRKIANGLSAQTEVADAAYAVSNEANNYAELAAKYWGTANRPSLPNNSFDDVARQLAGVGRDREVIELEGLMGLLDGGKLGPDQALAKMEIDAPFAVWLWRVLLGETPAGTQVPSPAERQKIFAEVVDRVLKEDFEGARNVADLFTGKARRASVSDPVRDIVMLAIRASDDLPFNSINGRPADDFMADAVTELLAGRATFDTVFPQSPDRAVFLQAARNYMDRAGYLANGLISNPKLKEAYPGLTLYGDMFSTNKRPIASAYGIGNAVPHHVAADAFQEALNFGTQAMRLGVQQFTSGAFNVMPNGMPTALYVPVRKGTQVDNNGRVQTEGMFGVATYVSSDPQGALRTKADDTPARNAFQARAQDIVDRVGQIDAQLFKLRGQQVMSDTSVGAKAATDEMTKLFEQREGLLQALIRTGRSFDDVAPVVTRASKPADFQQSAVYTSNDPLVGVLQGAIGQQDDRALNLFNQSLGDGIDGDDLYSLAMDVLERSGMSETSARNVIVKELMSEGYDAAVGTLDDGGAAVPVFAIFNSDDVRSLRSPDLLAEPQKDVVLKSGVGMGFWELVASETKLSPSKVGAVEDYLLYSGMAEDTSKVASKMLTGARGGFDSFIRSFFDGAEQRFQKAGMKTLADKFSNFTAEHTRMTGNIIMPLLEGVKRAGNRQEFEYVGLNNLPGMPKGYFAKIANYMTTAAQGNQFMGMQLKEPAPLQRLRAAMIDPSKASDLANEEERKMYTILRQNFQAQLVRMKNAGVLVGDLGPDYFPQVWNPEFIRRNEADFKALMREYFLRERGNALDMAAAGGEPVEQVMAKREKNAKDFADKIYNNITGNETGVVDFDSPSGMVDSVDFSRLLQFQRNAPDLLDWASKYQEQSLMATVVRYFDETERVIQQADHFGINGHGIMDYAYVLQEGPSGVIELLQTDKQFSLNQKTVGPDGLEPDQKKTLSISMLNPRDAKKFGERAIALAKSNDPAAAKRLLMQAYPSDGKPPITYERRVNAIVDALSDFKGEPASIRPDDVTAVNGYSKLIMRRPASEASQTARKVSRTMRAVQNVTLLSYATISSFSDLAMPIIRSGDFKAAWQGWSKYLNNKEYRDTIRRIGIAMDGITHERMAQMIGDGSNVVQSTYFKLTGLTPWTNAQRAGAAAIGEHGLRHHMEAMKKMGVGARNTPAYMRHKRELMKFGMTYEGDQPLPKLGGGTDADHMFERAVIRFTDATIFSPKPHDMPLFANNPWGALAYQLKSFSIMYGRFAVEMLKDEPVEAWKALAKGDIGTAAQYMKKPALLMTLGPAIASASIAGKDLVMARGGEEGQSVGINQTTKFSNIVGPEWSDEQLDAIAGWYTHSFMQAGGLGLLGDILRTTVEQSDNGAYGQLRVADAILGPTFGLGMDLVASVGAVGDMVGEAAGADVTPGRQRQMIRDTVGRVPFLGGNRAFKEGFVDALKPMEGKSSGVGGSAYKRTTYGTTEF